jgi:hypothetical protein
MAFVAPAVSIIGGVAGIASKNQQARAQQEQINAQAYQAKVAQIASEDMLSRQQVLARQEYELGTLSRLQQFSQAQSALSAQAQMTALKAQQDEYAIQYQAMQQRGALSQQADQLERQQTEITTGTDARIGASASKEGAIATQLNTNTLKQLEGQTAEDRKRFSSQAAGRLASTSNLLAREASLSDSLADAFSQGLETDRTAVLAHIQQLSEEEMALISERIGLNDNASNLDTVASNIKLVAMGAEGGLNQVRSDLRNNLSTSEIASRLMTNDANSQARAAQEAYRTQDYSLGTQRDIADKTGQSQQSAFQSAAANTRGAGFMDYLNLGVTAYGAVSPLLGGGASAADRAKSGNVAPLTPVRQTLYSGYVPGNNA